LEARSLCDGGSITRRQDAPPAFYRDGTIYLTRRDTIVNDGDLYGARCLPLVLPANEVLTIDESEDWDRAERRLES